MSIYRGYSEYTKTKGVINLICENTKLINQLRTDLNTINSIDITGELADLQTQKVDVSGDTMTGDLIMNSGTLDLANAIYKKPLSVLTPVDTTITTTDYINDIIVDGSGTYIITTHIPGHNGYKLTVTRNTFGADTTIQFIAPNDLLVDVSTESVVTDFDMNTPGIYTNGATVNNPISSVTLIYYNNRYHIQSFI